MTQNRESMWARLAALETCSRDASLTRSRARQGRAPRPRHFPATAAAPSRSRRAAGTAAPPSGLARFTRGARDGRSPLVDDADRRGPAGAVAEQALLLRGAEAEHGRARAVELTAV